MTDFYNFDREINRRRAKEWLAALLPQAEERLASLGPQQASFSDAGATIMQHVHIDRLDGVHIFVDPEGWRYGLVYRNMPPGVPRKVVSTDPYPTPAVVVLAATDALALVLLVSKRGLLAVGPGWAFH